VYVAFIAFQEGLRGSWVLSSAFVARMKQLCRSTSA
jgi:hypothetical protein